MARANKPVLPAQVQAKLARVKQAQVQLQKVRQAVQNLQQATRHQLETQMVVCQAMEVNLQRSASRVPYNQSAVDDSNNPAWTFADGVLEQILATSRARGYITGNQYILERVNIVNGNGYYNLYKPDGTYLFTLNCKTGYFVEWFWSRWMTWTTKQPLQNSFLSKVK